MANHRPSSGPAAGAATLAGLAPRSPSRPDQARALLGVNGHR